MITIAKLSPVTWEENYMTLDVTQEQLDAWQGGVLIQDAMPNLSDDEREFLMTGILPDEWDRLFPEEEEEDSPNYWEDLW